MNPASAGGMTNKKSYKERETEQKRGRLRYLERLAEDEEARQEIAEYHKEEQEDNDDEIQDIIRSKYIQE